MAKGHGLKTNRLDFETVKFNFQKTKSTFQDVERMHGPDIPVITSNIGIASKVVQIPSKFFPLQMHLLLKRYNQKGLRNKLRKFLPS